VPLRSVTRRHSFVQKSWAASTVWQFGDGKQRLKSPKSPKDLKAKTSDSDAMSKDLKRRGFNFVGSTICYAFMQAVGMVNDHVVGCFRYRISV
jgi:DNA-3-methyladenine glycosylase I